MFEGTLTALVTPFRRGEVDEAALRELVSRQIEAGIDGLVPCGTTGESVTLTHDEHARVVRIVVAEARGRVPVIAGAGTVATRHTIDLCKLARESKCDGVLLVCPYYNRPTQAGLEAHFRAVLREVSIPAILYNIPVRTGVDMSAETLAKLADVPEIVAIKEATGNVLRAQEILARCGDRFGVLSGEDALTLPIVAVGGTGVVSVTANLLPKSVSQVVRLARSGDFASARALHLRLLPVHQAMFVESNPGPIKAALAARGHMSGEVRLPLVAPGEAPTQTVLAAVAAAGLAQ